MVVAVFLAAFLVEAKAIVVSPDLDDHDALHPTRAPMLDSVGRLGESRAGSAVYLGKGWILTANHAFANCRDGAVYFSGQRYQMRSRRAVRLKNPGQTGAGVMTDLVMVPLTEIPNLPAIAVNQYPPFTGELVVMAGFGETSSDGEGPMILTGASPAVGRATPDSPRWGENVVSERGMQIGVDGEGWMTQAYATVKQPHWTPTNAQGARGDSGGGVFVKRGERWQLSGIMLSVLHREDLNASATFIADLSVYRDQINATIPEPSVITFVLVGGMMICGRRSR